MILLAGVGAGDDRARRASILAAVYRGGDFICAGGESGVSGVADQLQILRGSAVQSVSVLDAGGGFHAAGGSDSRSS